MKKYDVWYYLELLKRMNGNYSLDFDKLENRILLMRSKFLFNKGHQKINANIRIIGLDLRKNKSAYNLTATFKDSSGKIHDLGIYGIKFSSRFYNWIHKKIFNSRTPIKVDQISVDGKYIIKNGRYMDPNLPLAEIMYENKIKGIVDGN